MLHVHFVAFRTRYNLSGLVTSDTRMSTYFSIWTATVLTSRQFAAGGAIWTLILTTGTNDIPNLKEREQTPGINVMELFKHKFQLSIKSLGDWVKSV